MRLLLLFPDLSRFRSFLRSREHSFTTILGLGTIQAWHNPFSLITFLQLHSNPAGVSTCRFGLSTTCGSYIQQFACWKVRQNERNRETSKNARRPEEKLLSVRSQAGAKLNVPALASFRWRLQRNLLTKIKSADKENLLTESAEKMQICWQRNLLTESADKRKSADKKHLLTKSS